MDIREELKSAGVYPSGPCSAWPESRNEELLATLNPPKRATKVKASSGDMAKGLVQNAGAFLRGGKFSKDVYDSRYNTCKNCPSFIEQSKRCSECGCFMKAKAWINQDPDKLCPLQKWIK